MSDNAPPTPFSHKPVSLSELLASLGPYLTPPDLLSGVCVLRLWNTVLIPYLWRIIDDRQHSWPKILAARDSVEAQGHQDDEWLHRIFVEYGGYIRSMEIHWNAMFSPTNRSGTCTNLRRIAIHVPYDGETLKDIAEFDLIAGSEDAAGGNTLNWADLPGELGPLLSPLLKGVFEPAVGFGRRTETQQPRDWMSHQHLWLLIRQNPNLNSLQLDYSLHTLSNFTSAEFFNDSMSLLPYLVELQCDGVPKALSELLENGCPTSSIYIVQGSGRRTMKSFADAGQVLDHKPSNLKQLHFGYGSEITDEQLAAHLVPWLPKLTVFVERGLMPLTVEALRVHCRDLERLGQLWNEYEYYPERGCRPEVNEVGLLLRRCPRLKSLDKIRVQVEVDELLAYPWASTSLERISCQVSGVIRLTDTEQTIFNKPGVESGKEDLRVYERFAGMKHLKLLDFGYDYDQLVGNDVITPGQYLSHYGGSIHRSATRFMGPFKKTLELSLASGLSLLGGLQELETFRFEGVDHCIGEEELVWMNDHWPRLRTLHGLQAEGFDNPARAQSKEELRVVMKGLRPEIVFGRRF
ncbi:hypothetical protein BGW39_007098 [Mortierella sp. 14UC]|nr:hypothetical protein BGW39_007098 [Mortierella sp. 14UC]